MNVMRLNYLEIVVSVKKLMCDQISEHLAAWVSEFPQLRKPESFLFVLMNVLQFREPVKSAKPIYLWDKCLRYEMLPESLFRGKEAEIILNDWGSLSSHNRWSDNGRYCSKKRLIHLVLYIFLFFQILKYISSYSFLALTPSLGCILFYLKFWVI